MVEGRFNFLSGVVRDFGWVQPRDDVFFKGETSFGEYVLVDVILAARCESSKNF